MNNGSVGGVFLAVILVLGLICGVICTERIPAGYAGVVYNMRGGIEDDVLGQGVHIVSPTKKVSEYSVGIEQSYLSAEKIGDSNSDESFYIPTSDGKTVKVDLEFSYKFDVERLPMIFTNFKGKDGEDVKNDFIKPKIKAWTQEVSAEYPVTDIFGDKRTEINAQLDEYLRAKFDEYGIIIDTVNFANISVDAETEAAIQKKVTAQQELELAQIESQTAKIQAEKERQVAQIQAEKDQEVAKIKAETDVIKAEAEAEVVEIAAAAEAEANHKIASSLTPQLIDKIKYEKWNGQMPTVTGNSTSIIDLK